MKRNVVNWFEIPVSDFERARKFYSTLFDTEMQEIPMPNMKVAAFPWIEGGENATGAIVQAEHYAPSATGTMVYFVCEDIDAMLEKINELGGQTVTPKTSIGEHGFIAHFMDCEGNKVALHTAGKQ